MAFEAIELVEEGLSGAALEELLEEHGREVVPRLERFWKYYRNPVKEGREVQRGPGGRWLAQSDGLPTRLLGTSGVEREVVIENDIAWRIHAMVDFMFGRPFVVQSLAEDVGQARRIERFLHAVFEANGGVGFFQDLALLGAVYGYVDVLLRLQEKRGGWWGGGADFFTEKAERFVLEVIEAPRAVPMVNSRDYRRLDAYVIHWREERREAEAESLVERVGRRIWGGAGSRRRASVEHTEVWTAGSHLVFRDRRLVASEVNRLGRIPLVHIQNLSQPFFYEGLSEVEPLIPLQDELNTRLSDRANRVTFQSFRMYLGKGIENFIERPVGPGQMWATDNPEASIQEFGGDQESPSEAAHINEIREAMDKVSGVNPIAAGILRGRVGNLTSGNALRIVLMGLLAKTQRRRVTYGAGIERMCELLLHAADLMGVLPNRAEDRRVRIDWPSPLPEDDVEKLREAQLKVELGVPKEQVLAELGYGDWIGG